MPKIHKVRKEETSCLCGVRLPKNTSYSTDLITCAKCKALLREGQASKFVLFMRKEA